MDHAAPAIDWQTVYADILTEMGTWRIAHPRATFTEIEQALDTRFATARAQFLADLAGTTATPVSAPTCPHCQRPMQSRGRRQRTLRTEDDTGVVLERDYFVCPDCGRGVFPPR